MIPESVKEIRVVDIVGLDKQADGGTHVRTHRRGRPDPGRQDRDQGQGQQADPPRGRRWLSWPALHAASGSRTPQRRGGVQRRRRLGVPGLGRPRHARAASGSAAVTAVSPSLAADELDDCRALAAEWGLRWRPVATDELDDPAYRANDGERCYHCKSALMDALEPAGDGAGATVVLGVNVDDLGDHRPGQRAAAERGAVFPLVEAGFTKADVRDWSPRARPAHVGQAGRRLPGLAAALRHPVTVAVLGRVERAEAALRRAGLRRAPGAPLRRHRPPRGARRRPRRGASSGASDVVAAVQAAGLRLRHARPRGPALRQPQPCLGGQSADALGGHARPTRLRTAAAALAGSRSAAQATSRRRWSARWMRSDGSGSIQCRTCTPSQSTASADGLGQAAGADGQVRAALGQHQDAAALQRHDGLAGGEDPVGRGRGLGQDLLAGSRRSPAARGWR